MARLFVTGINLNKNELQNAVIQNIGSAPSSPVAGQIYYNTSTNVLYFYNGSEWIPASGSTEVIQDVIGASLVGGVGLTATYDDAAGETTIDLDNTSVVSGSYGASNKTVSFTVDSQGRLTYASDEMIDITASQVSDFSEATQDAISSILIEGEGIDIAYNDSANTLTISAEDASSTNKGVASFSETDFVVTNGNVELNNEAIQDKVGAMLTGNTETGITVTYQDLDGTIDFEVADQFLTHSTTDLAEGTNLYYTAERVQDEINNTLVAGTGLDATYDDGAGTYTLDIDSTVTTNSGSQILTNKSLGSGNALAADLDAANYKIINLGTPTASGDAVNKSYVDGIAGGLNWKSAVNLLDISLTPAFAGNALESPLIIDGHSALGIEDVGYRILITNGLNAGIYVYNQDSGTNDWNLTRSLDADSYEELIGAAVFVMEGNTYAATSWVQSNHYITDFTGQSWTQFSGAGTYLAGAGLILTGNTFSVETNPVSGNASIKTDGGATEVKTDTSRGLSVNSNGLGLNVDNGLTFNAGALAFAAGYGIRKHSESVGDAVNTSYNITHNFLTKDVTVQVYDSSSPYSQVEADVEHANNNYITIKFASAPSVNQYRVVVIG